MTLRNRTTCRLSVSLLATGYRFSTATELEAAFGKHGVYFQNSLNGLVTSRRVLTRRAAMALGVLMNRAEGHYTVLVTHTLCCNYQGLARY
jgi:hypothetical protein